MCDFGVGVELTELEEELWTPVCALEHWES